MEKDPYTLEIDTYGTRGGTRKNRCRHINIKVYDLGYSHALKGWHIESFNKTVKQCASYGFSLNRLEYHRGWTKGVHLFCTYKRGYEFGLYGGRYLKVCSTRNEADFLRGYFLGMKEYKRRKRELSLREQQIRRERELLEREQRAHREQELFEREQQVRREQEHLEKKAGRVRQAQMERERFLREKKRLDQEKARRERQNSIQRVQSRNPHL